MYITTFERCLLECSNLKRKEKKTFHCECYAMLIEERSQLEVPKKPRLIFGN